MKRSPNLRNEKFTPAILVTLVVVIALGVVSFFYIRQNNLSPQTTVSRDDGGVTNSSSSLESTSGEERLYESSRLGIRFRYRTLDLGQNVLVKEAEDTVYVYHEGTIPEQGQFVRVWDKDPNESTQQAVKKGFLKGYNEQQCFVTSWVDQLGSKPNAGVTAVISFPIVPTDAVTPWWENGKNCPRNYAVSNGLAYFWTADERLDRFVYFSIGQYYIPAESIGTSWHTTLELIQ